MFDHLPQREHHYPVKWYGVYYKHMHVGANYHMLCKVLTLSSCKMSSTKGSSMRFTPYLSMSDDSTTAKRKMLWRQDLSCGSRFPREQ